MYAFQSCGQQLSEQFGSRQGEPHRRPDYVNWRLGGFESIKDNLHNTDIEKAFDLPKRRAPDSKAGRNRCMRYSRTICAKASSDRYALFSAPDAKRPSLCFRIISDAKNTVMQRKLIRMSRPSVLRKVGSSAEYDRAQLADAPSLEQRPMLDEERPSAACGRDVRSRQPRPQDHLVRS